MRSPASYQRGYFTLFDVFEWVGLILGGFLGGKYGYASFGYAGGFVGILVGGVIGFIICRLPFAFAMLMMNRDLKTSSSQRLRERLHKGEYYIAHHLVARLLARGDDLSDEIPLFLEWMKAETDFCRRCGWISLKLVVPETRPCIDEYDPMESIEKCRECVAKITEELNLEKKTKSECRDVSV
ncbi:MAG: hypothetical protein LBQ81_08975 [Zoogloeaceae bacterium]|jgi:uncharacterized membrane protein|nr:hypothetical protein [Zoogloeaceae bacterium]